MLTMGAGASVGSGEMPGRPVFHPEIGLFFKGLREKRGWTQRQAEDIAARRNLASLTRQVLWRLESGKVKNIEPDVLRDAATLYELPYTQVAARFIADRYGLASEHLEEAVDRGADSVSRSVHPPSTDDSTNSKGGARDRKSVGGRNPVLEQRYQKGKAGALRDAGGAWRSDLLEAKGALDAAQAALARVLDEREDDSDAPPGTSKAAG